METNPRHLNLLSEFFKDSEEGWAHAITILEHGIKDIQFYKFNPSQLFGNRGRSVLVITFVGCGEYKVKVMKQNHLYDMEIYPTILYPISFDTSYDGSLTPVMLGISTFLDMARAGRLH